MYTMKTCWSLYFTQFKQHISIFKLLIFREKERKRVNEWMDKEEKEYSIGVWVSVCVCVCVFHIFICTKYMVFPYDAFYGILWLKETHKIIWNVFSHSVSLSAIDPFGLRATTSLFFMKCNLNSITTRKRI